MNEPLPCNALLITNPTNIRYLTGFVGLAPYEREAYAFIAGTTIYLLTNSLYIEQARGLKQPTRLANYAMKVIQTTQEEPMAIKVKLIVETLPQPVRVGYEEQNLTIAEYSRLKSVLPTIELLPTRDSIETMRRVKKSDEIEAIRKAAGITDACLSEVLPYIKPGITEQELAWAMESYQRTHGAGLAFAPIVSFGHNTSKPHYDESENRKLEAQDIILLDFGAKVNGYCADMTRMVFMGTPKVEWVKAYETLKISQQTGIDELSNHDNISGAAVDAKVRSIIEQAGFPTYPHSLGHSVGLDIHEGPRLTIHHDELLVPGNVFSIEPGIYMEGNFGIRIEDLVTIHESGVEVLSKSPKELLVL